MLFAGSWQDPRKDRECPYPILEKIVDRFKKSVANDAERQEAVINYDIDEYDEDREEMIDGSDIPSLRDETDRVIDTIGAKPNVDSGVKQETGQG